MPEEIRQLHDRKNADYSKAEDPLRNFRICEAFRIPTWKDCLVQMSDKWSRLVQLANKPAPVVKDEAITDTMTDLAVYSLLCRILWEEAYGKSYLNRDTGDHDHFMRRGVFHGSKEASKKSHPYP